MTKIKICGITNTEDALFAAANGADSLGFNFYGGSPRYISPASAAEIIAVLPPEVGKVGVFVNSSIEEIIDIVRITGLNAIQLHGDEKPDFVRELRDRIGFEIIRALRVSDKFRLSDVLAYDADAILLDAYSSKGYGGTGEKFDWEIARQVQNLVRTYLAGGLNPQNVATAVNEVRPYAVDACSGLEREKGLKDNFKLAAFIEAVRGV